MGALIQTISGYVRSIQHLRERWERPVVRVLQFAVPLLLISFLLYKLSKIGWAQVWASRPSSLIFYIVLIIPFLLPSLGDLLIYRSLWKVGSKLPFLILLRKQCLNYFVLDYSGEAYFFLWCRRNLNLDTNVLAHSVKDANVLSAGAGLVTLFLSVSALIAFGGFNTSALIPVISWSLLPLMFLPLVLCAVLVIGGRRVTTLTRRQIALTFAIQTTRATLGLILNFATWWFSGALGTFALCIEFVVLRQLVFRIPMVPNKELIFASAGVAAAGALNLSQPAVAAVLVIMALYEQLVAATVVAAPWLFEKALQRPKAA